MPRARIYTKGYWPLPDFKDIYYSGKWRACQEKKITEKMTELKLSSMPTGIPKGVPKNVLKDMPKKTPTGIQTGIIILEAHIGKALSKKIYLQSGARKILLSRWFGGLYSNANTRSPSQVMEYYDAIAGRYEFNTEPEREKQLETIAIHIKNEFAKDKFAKKDIARKRIILDASAGRCLFAKAAKKHGLEVTSMDISKNMLGINENITAKNQGAGLNRPKNHGAKDPGVKIHGSIASPPFEKESFDCVVHLFSNLLSYDRKAFPKLFGILKQGGLLVYLPVKSPGEQWLPDWREKTIARLAGCGFVKIEKISVPSIGRKKSVLTFIKARKKD